MSEITKEKITAEDYLQDCIMQKIQNEVDEYHKNAEPILDKYSNLAIKYLPILGIGVSSSLVLLHSPLSFKASSQLIGLFVLIFAIAVMLIARFYIKNKDDLNLRFDIYDSWKKTILAGLLVNFGLYIFSDNAYSEMLVISAIAAFALIVIQRGVKRSL